MKDKLKWLMLGVTGLAVFAVQMAAPAYVIEDFYVERQRALERTASLPLSVAATLTQALAPRPQAKKTP